MTAAAFFDLDRTLIDCNSALLYAKHEFRGGRISLKQMAQSIWWTALYHLSVLDMDQAYAKAASHYRGKAYAELQAHTDDWFRAHVMPRVLPGAYETLRHHRSAGLPLVMLSNTSCFEARVASAELEMDDWLANEFPVDERGAMTGEIRFPLCYGEGKVHYAERWAAERGVDLDVSFFYSDSYTDLPMLERVGYAAVVNPDPRLSRHAKRKGWPILDWSNDAKYRRPEAWTASPD